MPKTIEKPKFTPGPLTFERRRKQYIPPSELAYIINKDAAYTALVPSEHDARLYAAAPDLYDECEESLECLKWIMDALAEKLIPISSLPGAEKYAAIGARIKTALAKARV